MTDSAMQNQQIFRELVQALAYPGKKVTLAAEDDFAGDLFPETMAILFALLDGEVTYHILGNDKTADQELQFRTLAQKADIEIADYIVVPLNQVDQIPAIINQCKKGTLLDPNLSATLIIECRHLKTAGNLTWSGPGIKTTAQMSVNASENWLAARSEAVSEFPLGMDIFLVGEDGGVVGLPRTTKVEGGE